MDRSSMSMSLLLLDGLGTTLFIALASLLICILPGSLLYWGRKSGIKPLYILCTAYVEFFEGIPIIAQLFFLYYGLPILSPALSLTAPLTAIIVLSLNGAGNIATFSKMFSQVEGSSPTFNSKVKTLVLSAVKVFGELVKYSSLLAVIGITELIRAANMSMQAKMDISFMVGAVIIYGIINLTVKILIKVLQRRFSGTKRDS
ncbi:inner membrane amino-acid ABC transporter permease protein YecS [Ruminiclostridium hungatei]|uniref:Inner membrane amino-acid ABC transporter permease protein YecS n=1 Tax=Ruminiclostridium hungatei TaxID=48256 RepID=A0A1V4SJN9_RUMHU|nr:ABC transporter permease subunit [Ruminiclostridium hungatei]OPX44119.1 inner membrane amino-acid ABC transporter permease protein YecS [Ruminiclostridium hungatei]